MSRVEIEEQLPNSLNNIPVQSGNPESGQTLLYDSTNNQWVFDTISGSSLPATSTSLGTVQLAGDLSGTATAPLIKTYAPNMSSNVSRYNVLGQDTQTGKTLSVPISYSSSGKIAEFEFTQLILTSNSVAIGLRSTTTNFTANGTGYVSRFRSNVPLDLATLDAAQITSTYNSLVHLSTPSIDGCIANESEKWQIFLQNDSGNAYYLDIYYFNHPGVESPIVATLYGIS